MRQNPYRFRPPPGWDPINTAPRDGTIIEVQCNYGVAPWFGLYRWEDGGSGARWWEVGGFDSSFTEGGSFSWRPYTGDPERYIDPTGGEQDTRNYWLAAAGYPPAPTGFMNMRDEDEILRQQPRPRTTPHRREPIDIGPPLFVGAVIIAAALFVSTVIF